MQIIRSMFGGIEEWSRFEHSFHYCLLTLRVTYQSNLTKWLSTVQCDNTVGRVTPRMFILVGVRIRSIRGKLEGRKFGVRRLSLVYIGLKNNIRCLHWSLSHQIHLPCGCLPFNFLPYKVYSTALGRASGSWSIMMDNLLQIEESTELRVRNKSYWSITIQPPMYMLAKALPTPTKEKVSLK